MKIKFWEAYNFGPYAGKVSIEFPDPTDKKSIVCIYGLNGKGKTTFINSIKLTLHGEKANLAKDDSYQQYLYHHIHKNERSKSNPQAYVMITLTINNGDEIEIKRSWKFLFENKIRETVQVRVNGKFLQFNEEEDKKAFVNNIIPMNVLQFYAFDAEKIRYVAEANGPYTMLEEDIHDTLNISKYTRTLDILNKFFDYTNKKRKNATESHSARLLSEKLHAKELLDNKRGQLSRLEQNINGTEKEHQAIKRWLMQRGYQSKETRENLEIKLELLKEDKNNLMEQFDDFINSFLPFMVCFETLYEMDAQLTLEIQEEGTILANDQMKRQKLEFLDILQKDTSPPLIEKQKKELTDRFSKQWDHSFPSSQKLINLYHLESIPKQNRDDFLNEFNGIYEGIRTTHKEAYRLLEEYERKKEQVTELEEELHFLPTHTETDERIVTFQKLNNDLKQQNDDKCAIIQEIDGAKENLLQKEKALKSYELELKENEKIIERINSIERVQKLIEHFSKMLKQEKAKDVERYTEETFKSLAHKDNYIEKFNIDQNTFELKAFEKDNEEILLRYISEGEKQIYGLSLSSALAKSAGHDFPFIIDAPLIKLDTLHQENVMKEFFPTISKQVILLTTDDEMNPRKRKKIKPHLLKEFTLDMKNGETKILEGCQII